MTPVYLYLAPAIVSLLLMGCQRTAALKVTEVGPNYVEILLDQPDAFNLTNMKLQWIYREGNAQSVAGEVDLGVAGTLQGRQYLVIWEEPLYADPPVAQDYRAPFIRGIKVADGLFPPYGNDPSVSMVVRGVQI